MATKTTPTLAEVEERYVSARERLQELQADGIDLTDPTVPFPEGVAAAKRHREDLSVAEDELLAAWRAREEHRQRDRREREAAAQQVLTEATPRLCEAATKAEQFTDELIAQLRIVIAETQRRHEALQVSRERNMRSHLVLNAVNEWLSWRLQELNLPGIPKWVNKQYRKPLLELLLPDAGDATTGKDSK